jgi:phospholipid-transporting ATPase
MGKEGNQASSFADYAIPRFENLRRLLFWHGRPFGVKLSMMILYGLFKSVLFSTCIFYLQFVNGSSGQQPIEAFIYAMYEVNMTTFAMVATTIYTNDVPYELT